MSNGFGQTTLAGLVKWSTERAILFEFGDDEFWIPRSVCLDGDAVDVNDTDVTVADWWLEQEGIDG